MRKDTIRDYATEAFRYYAAKGMTYEILKEKYYNEALESYQRTHEKGTGISKPTEQAVIYAENKLRKKQAELWDMLAVEKALAQLPLYIKSAVEIVYFTNADKDLEKGEISERVQCASTYIYSDVSTIYRHLRKARKLFAYERGLRM